MKKKNRRQFLKKASHVAGAIGMTGAATSSSLLLSSCNPDEKIEDKNINLIISKKYEWKMTTTWPPNFPIMGTGCQDLARWVEEMSGGRMKIKVFGGGELIPALEGFEAVSSGAVEMNHGASYYWTGRMEVAPFFCAVPFGMNAMLMNAWITSGGGQSLWDELYAPFDLKGFAAGNTGIQMGGWFNKKIGRVEDLKGLKMRIPGFGGKILNQAGGTAITVSGGEIYTNLERGVIDATEWIGPYHDFLMGFHEVAKYYYYPGWHETGPTLELLVNKSKFEKLPKDLQTIIETACARLNTQMQAEFDFKNQEYLKKILNLNSVSLLKFPDDFLNTLKEYSKQLVVDLGSKTELGGRIAKSYTDFFEGAKDWYQYSEKSYFDLLKD